MSRYPKIEPATVLDHIDKHCRSHGLAFGSEVFEAMHHAGNTTSSMALLFGVQWRTMENWREIYRRLREG